MIVINLEKVVHLYMSEVVRDEDGPDPKDMNRRGHHWKNHPSRTTWIGTPQPLECTASDRRSYSWQPEVL